MSPVHQQRSQERRQQQKQHFGSCNRRKQPHQAQTSWTKGLCANEFLDILCSQRLVSLTRNVRTRARAAITDAPDHQVFGNTQGASKPKSIPMETCSIEKLNQHGQKRKKPCWAASARNAGKGLSKTFLPSQRPKSYGHLCHRCNSRTASGMANSRSSCQLSGSKVQPVSSMLLPCRIETVHSDDVVPICKICKLSQRAAPDFWRPGPRGEALAD